MGYNFEMGGEFKFNKPLPEKALETLRELSENWEVDDLKTMQDLLGVKDICTVWTPWILDEDDDSYLVPVEDVGCLNHNYWFIDWICWIIQSVCIPNGVMLNGEGWWQDDGNIFDELGEDAEGNGSFTVKDNIVKVKGVFFGNDHWKKTVRKHNKLVKGNGKVLESKPSGECKGSFCVTGKVSVPRNELQWIGVEAGFEFKSSISSGLTYLVCDNPNSTSTKMKKAKDLGIKVISESEFMEIIGKN